MNHQTISDVSDRIGALELGALNAVDDGALESITGLHLGPTGMTCPAPQTMRPICRYIDDGALEQAAAHVEAGPPPTSIRFPNGQCNGR